MSAYRSPIRRALPWLLLSITLSIGAAYCTSPSFPDPLPVECVAGCSDRELD